MSKARPTCIYCLGKGFRRDTSYFPCSPCGGTGFKPAGGYDIPQPAPTDSEKIGQLQREVSRLSRQVRKIAR